MSTTPSSLKLAKGVNMNVQVNLSPATPAALGGMLDVLHERGVAVGGMVPAARPVAKPLASPKPAAKKPTVKKPAAAKPAAKKPTAPKKKRAKKPAVKRAAPDTLKPGNRVGNPNGRGTVHTVWATSPDGKKFVSYCGKYQGDTANTSLAASRDKRGKCKKCGQVLAQYKSGVEANPTRVAGKGDWSFAKTGNGGATQAVRESAAVGEA